MIKYIVISKDDIKLIIHNRLEILKEANEFIYDYIIRDELVSKSREYFENANQTTILDINRNIIDCAKLCYI